MRRVNFEDEYIKITERLNKEIEIEKLGIEKIKELKPIDGLSLRGAKAEKKLGADFKKSKLTFNGKIESYRINSGEYSLLVSEFNRIYGSNESRHELVSVDPKGEFSFKRTIEKREEKLSSIEEILELITKEKEFIKDLFLKNEELKQKFKKAKSSLTVTSVENSIKNLIKNALDSY